MTESGFSTMGFFDERFPEYCSIPMKALVGLVYSKKKRSKKNTKRDTMVNAKS